MAKPSIRPRDEPPGDDRLVSELATDAQELDDDVEDRAGGQGEESNRDSLADPRLAEQCPEEGRAAADQADKGEEAPASVARSCPRTGRRCRNPRWRCEDRSRRTRTSARSIAPEAAELPDRESFGEVVQPDPRPRSSARATAPARAPRPAPRTLRSPRRRRCECRRGGDAWRSPSLKYTRLIRPTVNETTKIAARAANRAQLPLSSRAAAVSAVLDGLDPGCEYVPEEKEQDPRRDRRSAAHLVRARHAVRAPRRQAEEDGETSNRAEYEDLRLRHVRHSEAEIVRITLQPSDTSRLRSHVRRECRPSRGPRLVSPRCWRIALRRLRR